ncbi:unnamed protein product [Lathyrus oleraceus]
MFITLDDATCLLRLPIKGRLLNYSQMSRLDALDMMVTYLGADPGETQIGINATRGIYARFSYLEKLYEYHLVSSMENEGDDKQVLYHRQCAIRSYLMHLAWILSHFSHISGWALDDNYIEDWPRDFSYIWFRGNPMIESFRVFIDCTVADDTCYYPYDDHHQTCLLDNISLYFG